MTFFDPGILAGALLSKHPEHANCVAAFDAYEDAVTDSHALAETFATLTGFYKVPTALASELTLGLREQLEIEAFRVADYATATGEAQSRGVMGEASTIRCMRPLPAAKA